MNEVEKAHRDMLAALVMEYHRATSGFDELNDVKARYNLKIADSLLLSSIAPWENADWLIVSRTKDGVAARIKDSTYSEAHGRLLTYLDAEQLMISWKKEEISSDSNPPDWFPLTEGWKWLTFDKRPSSPPAPAFPASASSISITNTFQPTNSTSFHNPADSSGKSAARAGWLNVWVALFIGVAVIVVSLWIAGKL